MKILIIKQTSLGDVLHSTVAIDAIKKKYPDAKITYLVDISAQDIVKYNPDVDRIILFHFNYVINLAKKNIFKVIKYFYDKIKELRNEEYDIAFDLQGLERSVLFLYFARAKEKYVKGRYPLLKGYKNKDIHATTEILSVLSLAKIKSNNTRMSLYIPDDIEKKVLSFIQKINPDKKPIITISPFTRWETKNWGVDKFKDLIKLLEQKDYIIFLTGTKEDQSKVESMIDRNLIIDKKSIIDKDDDSNLTKKAKEKIFNLAGKLSILEFASLIKHSNLLVSCESFPPHIASTLHTPVIVLMGPTDEKRIGPINTRYKLIRAENVLCSKCYKRRCKKMDCMKNIMSEVVYESIVNMIENR